MPRPTKPFTLFGGTISTALVHAATQYDMRQQAAAAKARARGKHGYHNIYALSQYLMRIDAVIDDIAAGATVRAAIVAAFSDRLLDVMLKAVGEVPHTPDEKHRGIVTYKPAATQKDS